MGFLKDIFSDGRPLKKEVDREPIFGYKEAQPTNPITPEERREILNTLINTEVAVKKPHNLGPTVKDIHNEFYTEVDRLIAEANVQQVIKIQDEAFETKAESLKKLGFDSHPDVIRYSQLLSSRHGIEKSNRAKNDLLSCIDYFSHLYPHYKFITFDGINRICKKYNLAHGPINKYMGEIPNKNLQHMVSFKINDKDKAHIHNTSRGKETYVTNDWSTGSKIAPWVICAPQKDFDLRNSEMVGYEIRNIVQPLDPVVIQPVRYSITRHGSTEYLIGGLIITAWGDEAKDEEVVNQKMN